MNSPLVDDAVGVLASGRPYPISALRADRQGSSYVDFQNDSQAVRERLARIGLKVVRRVAGGECCYVAVPVDAEVSA